MKIIQIPSPNHYGRDGYGVLQVVIHTMEAPESEGRAVWCGHYFQNPSLEASAHYMVDDKQVVQGVQESQGAWACPFFNRSGIQIEHAGYAKQDASDWQDDYSQAMLHLSAQVSADVATRHGIPVRRLSLDEVRKGTVKGFLGHWDATRAGVGENTHTDPGPNFPWGQYLDLVKAYQAGKKPPTTPAPPKPKPTGKPAPLTVDGVIGPKSTDALEYLAGVGQDGQISGQPRSIRTDAGATLDACWPTLTYGTGGSRTIAWLQGVIGVTQDGFFGPATRKALQKFLHVVVDGLPGYGTCKALQAWINSKLNGEKPVTVGSGATTRHLLRLDIPGNRVLQNIMHNDSSGRWFTTQVSAPDAGTAQEDTLVTRLDAAGNRIDSMVWVDGGHGHTTTLLVNGARFWTYWPKFGPAHVQYAPGERMECADKRVTKHGSGKGSRCYQIDQANRLVLVRWHIGDTERYDVHPLDDLTKTLHTITTPSGTTLGAWQGMALDGEDAIWIVRGGVDKPKYVKPTMHRYDLANGKHETWDISGATADLPTSKDHNEPEGMTLATLDGKRTLVFGMATGPKGNRRADLYTFQIGD